MDPILLSRRRLVLGVSAAAAAGWFPALASEASDASSFRGRSPAPLGFPRQDQRVVRELVGASHRSLERVKELVSERPALATSAWDWGFGDWESALGAAAHTGQREIARYLIEQGARIDIFAAAMLGELRTVRAFCEASPGIQGTPGPHGIPLLAHARAGGDAAAPVVEYLRALGGADNVQAPVELSEDERLACIGRYSYGPAEGDWFEITRGRNWLQFVREPDVSCRLNHLGDTEFAPAGAAAVRLRFTIVGNAASSVLIRDGELKFAAMRMV